MDRRHFISALTLAPSALLAAKAWASPKAESSGGAGGQLRMALVTATVLRRNGRRAILSVESTLDIPDGALLERAKLSKPRLNAGYNEAIQIQAARQLTNSAPDLDAITAALQQATDRILGRSGAKVLLGTVMVT